MDQQAVVEPESLPTSGEVGPDWAAFIQQQVQHVLQAAIPHIVRQITEQAAVGPRPRSPSNVNPGNTRFDDGVRESKVADPERFSGKKGNEVYRWFAQLRLVFRGKPRTYHSDADKVAFALSYMAGAAQNWAMPLLQALDEGREHELLEDYAAFREAVIGVYGDLDRRGNAEDRLARLRQIGSVATYISTFNEYAAQIDWNESSLIARFRNGLKDDILDSVATAETQPSRLHEWMAMASRIDERLWSRRQTRRPSTDSPNVKVLSSAFLPRDPVGKFQSQPVTSGPVPMELGAVRGPPALAKTAAERLEYQRQGRCWGCGELGHIRAKCPTNPSRPLSLAAATGSGSSVSGKGVARD
jgi:Retrotransposon gag protein